MSHQQEIDFCNSVKKSVPQFFAHRFVVDLGSLDINGNNHYLFDDCLYLGVDLLPGKNVDLAVKGHELRLPDESVDVVISTECFEHDQFYPLTLNNAARMLKPGGLFMFTCATTGRPEHGTRRTTPADAPFTLEFGEWADYYKNLEEPDIQAALDLNAIFDRCEFSTNSETHDLYFWGVKKGVLVDRCDYSTQFRYSKLRLALKSKEMYIDELRKIVGDRDGQVRDFKCTVAEQRRSVQSLSAQLAATTNSKAEMEMYVDKLRKIVDERDGQIHDFKRTVTEQHRSIQFLSAQLAATTNSKAWKIAMLIRDLRVLVAPPHSRRARTLRHVKNAVFAPLARKTSAANPAGKLVRAPEVSVVIPIYDRTDILRESIESILQQSHQDFELILVCDGSPEETLDIVRHYEKNSPKVRAFYFRSNSGNAVRGRNKAIKEARGKYLAFHDSDDVADCDRLKRSVKAIEKFNADVVYGGWRAIVDGSRKINLQDGQEVFSPDFDIEMLRKACVPCQSTVMAKVDCLRAVGGLSESMRYREDHELWLRLAHNGYRFKAIPKILTNLRLHENNLEIALKKEDAHWTNVMMEEYVKDRQMKPKIGYVIPTTGICGGIAVICQHVIRLMLRGYDVTMISEDNRNSISWYPDQLFDVIPLNKVSDNYDILIATGWSTAPIVDQLPAKRKLYFVQSDERRFYPEGNPYVAKAWDTYKLNFEFLTIGRWLQNWLKDEFGKDSVYVPNGLDETITHPTEPIAPKTNKVRVLLEGPIAIPFKGMSDAFEAVEGLDCEVWCVSSCGAPKPEWRCDRFFEKVPYGTMKSVYSSCDILLKMSRVEGVCLPPLEMMACGGTVVVGQVTGIEEYVVDGFNALVVPQGDVQAAHDALQRLIEDQKLRKELTENGKNTAKQWRWEKTIDTLEKVMSGELVQSGHSNAEPAKPHIGHTKRVGHADALAR